MGSASDEPYNHSCEARSAALGDYHRNGLLIVTAAIRDKHGRLRFFDGSLQMRLAGPIGKLVIVERSVDLQAWRAIQTNSLPVDGLALSIPLVSTKQSILFVGFAKVASKNLFWRV